MPKSNKEFFKSEVIRNAKYETIKFRPSDLRCFQNIGYLQYKIFCPVIDWANKNKLLPNLHNIPKLSSKQNINKNIYHAFVLSSRKIQNAVENSEDILRQPKAIQFFNELKGIISMPQYDKEISENETAVEKQTEETPDITDSKPENGENIHKTSTPQDIVNGLNKIGPDLVIKNSSGDNIYPEELPKKSIKPDDPEPVPKTANDKEAVQVIIIKTPPKKDTSADKISHEQSIERDVTDNFEPALKPVIEEPHKELKSDKHEKTDDVSKEDIQCETSASEPSEEIPNKMKSDEYEKIDDISKEDIQREPTVSEPSNKISDSKIASETSIDKYKRKASECEPEKPSVESKKPRGECYMLKNGKLNEPYSDTLDFDKICKDQILDYSVYYGDFNKDMNDGLKDGGLKELGLELDLDKKEIKGKPTKAGDPAENYEFELTLRYETKKCMKRERIFLKILPDPKSMWKELEPPAELEDRKPHTDMDLIPIGEDKTRKLFFASKRGRSHAHKALFRDDHVTIKYVDDLAWSIIAVADGAGSAKLSRVGSQIACEKSVEYIATVLLERDDELKTAILKLKKDNSEQHHNELKNLLYRILAEPAFHSARAIQKEAKARNEDVKHFSTTLLLAIHRRFDFGDFFAGFWIGDGALSVYKKGQKGEEGKLYLLGTPDGGEYSGQTVFITMNKIMSDANELSKRIHFKLLDDFTALMAMTDGISDPKFDTDSNLNKSEFWDKLWNDLEKNVLAEGEPHTKLIPEL